MSHIHIKQFHCEWFFGSVAGTAKLCLQSRQRWAVGHVLCSAGQVLGASRCPQVFQAVPRKPEPDNIDKKVDTYPLCLLILGSHAAHSVVQIPRFKPDWPGVTFCLESRGNSFLHSRGSEGPGLQAHEAGALLKAIPIHLSHEDA